jgi:hypothetical protein
VAVNDDKATLNGTVNYWSEYDAAKNAAFNTNGVGRWSTSSMFVIMQIARHSKQGGGRSRKGRPSRPAEE